MLFYWAAPLILATVYVYFHLYLQRLWDALTTLPAVFPDGTPLDRMAYPWLLNGLVRSHFARLSVDQRAFTRIENGISIALAWWVVPFTLFIFWGRYIRLHDYYGSSWHAFLMIAAVLFGIVSYRVARRTLLTGPRARNDDAGFSPQMSGWRWLWEGIQEHLLIWQTLATTAALLLLSIGAFERPDYLAALGYRPYLDLRETELSVKPVNWAGSEVNGVKGARLRGADLRHAAVSDAFLVRGDLREATLKGADLTRANLGSATLSGADFGHADLDGAILDSVVASDEQPGSLRTSFENASLAGTTFRHASLPRAALSRARLHGTNFESANLHEAQFREVVDCERVASGIPSLMTTPSGSETTFRKANLKEADFSGAILVEADFGEAQLFGAMFTNAMLSGSDLSTAVGLQQYQLEKACGDEATKLPVGLKISPCKSDPC